MQKKKHVLAAMTSTRNTHAASIILPLNEHSWAGKPQLSFSTMELYSYEWQILPAAM